MNRDRLIQLGLNEKQIKAINRLEIEESFKMISENIKYNYVEYWKELNLKKKIEELRLRRYAFEYQNINEITDPERKQDAYIRLNMQNVYLEKLKDFYVEFDNILTNYAYTLSDIEAKCFIYLYIKSYKVKDASAELNISENYVRKMKTKFDKHLKQICVPIENVK